MEQKLGYKAAVAVAKMLVASGRTEINEINRRNGVAPYERRETVRGVVITQIDNLYYDGVSVAAQDKLREQSIKTQTPGSGKGMLMTLAGFGQMG